MDPGARPSMQVEDAFEMVAANIVSESRLQPVLEELLSRPEGEWLPIAQLRTGALVGEDCARYAAERICSLVMAMRVLVTPEPYGSDDRYRLLVFYLADVDVFASKVALVNRERVLPPWST